MELDILCVLNKERKALAFFFGKSKENDQLLNNLKNETKKYNIKIRILESIGFNFFKISESLSIKLILCYNIHK